MSADPGLAAAAQVLDLVDEELRLVRQGRPELLRQLHERRAAAMTALPAILSPDARALLERSVQRQHEVDALLDHGMRVIRGELGLVGRGRRLAHGYAPAGVRTRSRLDRTA
jgi:hypothetical protein